jgi:hypothetical protein
MVSRILKLKYLAQCEYQLVNGEDVGWVSNCACVTLDGPIVSPDTQPTLLMEITQMTFPGQPIDGDQYITDVVLLSVILHQHITILSSLGCLGSYCFQTTSHGLLSADQ